MVTPLTVGTPFVEGTAVVHAEVVEQGKKRQGDYLQVQGKEGLQKRRMATDSQYTHWLRLPILYPVVRRQLQLRSRTM